MPLKTMARMCTTDDARMAKRDQKTGRCQTVQAVKSLALANGDYHRGMDDSLVVASEHEGGDTTHAIGAWLGGRTRGRCGQDA